jgi:hypothetical protein
MFVRVMMAVASLASVASVGSLASVGFASPFLMRPARVRLAIVVDRHGMPLPRMLFTANFCLSALSVGYKISQDGVGYPPGYLRQLLFKRLQPLDFKLQVHCGLRATLIIQHTG